MKKSKKTPDKNNSPSFDEIIQYDHYGRKLQSEALLSFFKKLKQWLIKLRLKHS